jgi:hypothetical protein
MISHVKMSFHAHVFFEFHKNVCESQISYVKTLNLTYEMTIFKCEMFQFRRKFHMWNRM